MIATQKLRGIITAQGMTQQDVAKMLGVSPKTFYSKMKKGVFGSDEIYQLTKILDIKNPIEIFFAD